MTSEPPAATAPRATSHALLVGLGILLSRISGLVRERVFAHYFGNAPAAGAFKAALRIPNLLQNLFGEGVLSASFIPVYARLLAAGDAALARRVAGAVAGLLGVLVGVLSLAGVLVTPWMIDLVAPGFEGEQRLLTIRLVRILFPAVALLVLSAWCLGVLNSHRKFFLSYVAPVVWNAAMIAAMLLFGGSRGVDELAVVLAWGTLAGSALQLGVQLPFVLRQAGPIRLALDIRLEPVRTIARNVGPVIVSRGVVQLSAYVDTMIASYLGTLAVSSLAYAQTLALLPVSLFGMSVAAAELPQMASATGDEATVFAALRRRIDSGLGQIAFLVVPSVVALTLLGDLLVAALFQTGRFTADDTLLVWYVVLGSAIGLLSATFGRLYNSAFYALRDTRTPLRCASARVLLTALLGVLFAFPLRPLVTGALAGAGLPLPQGAAAALALGAVGLTASAGLAGWIEFLMLRGAMRRRIGNTGLAASLQLRLWAAALVAAGIAKLLQLQVLAGVLQALPRHPVVPAVVVVGSYGLGYFVLAAGLGVPEARGLLRRVLRA